MNFISSLFFFFLIIVFLIYYLIPQKWQWVVLLIASYVFYLAGNTYLVLYLIFTTLVIFYSGQAIGKINASSLTSIANLDSTNTLTSKQQILKTAKRSKLQIITIALLLNFGILALLKYSGMFLSSFLL